MQAKYLMISFGYVLVSYFFSSLRIFFYFCASSFTFHSLLSAWLFNRTLQLHCTRTEKLIITTQISSGKKCKNINAYLANSTTSNKITIFEWLKIRHTHTNWTTRTHGTHILWKHWEIPQFVQWYFKCALSVKDMKCQIG